MAAELAIVTAVYARLVGFADLTALLASATSVYSFVQQEATSADSGFPYVSIGNTTSVPFDSDTNLGFNATVTIHSFARGRTPKTIMEIMGEIYTALHRYDLAVSGYNLVDCLWDDTAEVLQEQDAMTFHGLQRFRINITGE